MKTSRFTDNQIIAILKQAEGGSPVPELCREHGISNATFYKWRSKFGGMDASLTYVMRSRTENPPLIPTAASACFAMKLRGQSKPATTQATLSPNAKFA